MPTSSLPHSHLAPLLLACLAASPALAAADAVQLEAMQISGAPLDEVAAAQEKLREVPGASNLVEMDRIEQGRVAGGMALPESSKRPLHYQPT